MMRTALFLGVLAAFGCAPSDGSKILVSETLDVEPQMFVYHKFQTDYLGTYTLTVSPQGGDVEGWVNPGASEPRFQFLEDGSLPLAKAFPVGNQYSLSGQLDWGGAHIVLYNRGKAPVKAKCRLKYLEQKPK
jgi:hypothetical protein